jgi:probable F420-dependent oxidoreductase
MSPDKRLGLTVPVWPHDLRRSCELAREAERLGYTDAWSAETAGPDGLSVATALGIATEQMRIGCAVVPAFTRSAPLIAMGALAAHQASGGRFYLGLGASSPVIVERWMGAKFERPYTRVAETLTAVRQALSGEKVRFEGTTMSVDGFRLEGSADVPIYLAALGPRMMQLASDSGDGIALFLASEEGVRIARRAVGDKEIVARLMCCPDVPPEDVRPIARWQLAPYLAVPAYNRFISAQGFDVAAATVAKAWGEGDRQAALESIPDELVDALVILGPADECKQRIEVFRDAGLDTPILMLFSPEGGAGTEAALRALAPL